MAKAGRSTGGLFFLGVLVLGSLTYFLAARGRGPQEDSLDRRLKASAAPRRPGTALVVLVDVSGSMGDSVADASGTATAKIIIARRAVLSILGKVEAFARKYPEATLQLAVHEFNTSCRPVVPLGRPEVARARDAVARMRSAGNTAIGDAMIVGKGDLDRAGLMSAHLLVVTDGENTHGEHPGDVALALSRLPEEQRPSVHFVAFDIEAAKFSAIKQAGGLVLPAADEKQLLETLDYILGEKILIEKPTSPK